MESQQGPTWTGCCCHSGRYLPQPRGSLGTQTPAACKGKRALRQSGLLQTSLPALCHSTYLSASLLILPWAFFPPPAFLCAELRALHEVPWGSGGTWLHDPTHQRSGQSTCSQHRALASLMCHDCFFIHWKMLTSHNQSGACHICSSVSCSVWVTPGGINKVNSARAEAVCSVHRMWTLPA